MSSSLTRPECGPHRGAAGNTQNTRSGYLYWVDTVRGVQGTGRGGRSKLHAEFLAPPRGCRAWMLGSSRQDGEFLGGQVEEGISTSKME